MNKEILMKHSLFADLSEKELNQALELFEGKEKRYKKGEYLNRIPYPLKSFGIVLSGTVQVYMDDISGNQMIMASVSSGSSFGESLAYLQRETLVYIQAITDAEVLWLSTENIRANHSKNHFIGKMTDRFIAMLAWRTLEMNDRIQTLSKKSIREKIETMLSQYVSKYGNEFDVPMDRENMAVYLGCDRSALSRELSHMQTEGYIEYRNNHFIVHKYE